MPKRKSLPHNGILDFRRQRFVDAYIMNGFREREAAISAGYAEKSAHVTASRLLKNAKIQAAISARMNELVMSKEEALYRLSEHGRGDLREFMGLSTEELKRHPKGWLIKKYEQKSRRLPGGKLLEEYVKIELTNPHDAVTTIAKHHGLLKDGVTININIELVQQAVDALKEAGVDPVEAFNALIAKAREKARAGN